MTPVPELRECRRFPGYFVDSEGKFYSSLRRGRGHRGNFTPIEKKVHANNKGYVQVSMYGGSERESVHVLILEEFVGPRPKGKWARHRDGNLQNNRLENLYWGKAGGTPRGSKRP